jgi:hypothetical protein
MGIGTKFGSITIDRKTSEHDVVIRREVIKRKKKLSKKYDGTLRLLSKNEAKFVVEKGREQFVIGSGQMWWHQFQPHTLTRDTGHRSVRQLEPFSCHQRE